MQLHHMLTYTLMGRELLKWRGKGNNLILFETFIFHFSGFNQCLQYNHYGVVSFKRQTDVQTIRTFS